MIAGVAHAFGVAGATATQRRKQGSPAGVWCDEVVILVTEGHAALVEAEQAVVRDSDAVRVAGEISEHRLGPGERRFSILPIIPELESRFVTPTTRCIGRQPQSCA